MFGMQSQTGRAAVLIPLHLKNHTSFGEQLGDSEYKSSRLAEKLITLYKEVPGKACLLGSKAKYPAGPTLPPTNNLRSKKCPRTSVSGEEVVAEAVPATA